MKKQNLPLSPHLQIYKPQITSILSITHRVSGFFLSISIILLVMILLALSLGESQYNFIVSLFTKYPLKLIFYPIIFGFSYHMLNGFRHILWDFGYLISNRAAELSGYFIIILSIIISVFTIKISGLI